MNASSPDSPARRPTSFALFARFESKLEQYRGNLGALGAWKLARERLAQRSDSPRACEAMLVVLDKTATFLLSGTGDLIEPDDGIVGDRIGWSYAVAAAKALAGSTELDARAIAERPC